MFTVHLCCHHDKVISRVHLMNVEQCQVAADSQTNPTSLAVSLLVGCYHQSPIAI